MRDMVNEFSFSFSGWKAYRRCPRLWWLKKVAAWRGWLRTEPDEVRLAYLLSKMTSLRGLAGNVVHGIVEECVTFPGTTEGEALALFRTRMRTAYRESLRGAWKKDPKRCCNLFEHYYQGNGQATKRRAQDVFADGAACVSSFFRRLPDVRALLNESKVLEMEKLQSFEIEADPMPVKVWVKLDLGLRSQKTAALHMIDWKTGRQRETDATQLLLYALYAHERHETPLEDLRLHVAYLRDPTTVEDIAVSDESLAALKDAIVRSAGEIREHLSYPGVNEAPEEAFPRTEDPSVCRWCEMFHRCHGHKDLSSPGEESS